MTTAFKESFPSDNNTITCTLASLASGSARASTAVDNTTNLDLDAHVFIGIKTGTISGTAYVNVYAYGTADGGTTYTESATGSDAALTLVSPTNLRFLGVVNTPSSTTTYYAGPFSVAACFGGILPEKWGIVIENKTGGALDSTEGNHKKIYARVQSQGV